MPTNRTHTTRIDTLETQGNNLLRRMKEAEDEQARHDVSIEDLHTRLSEIESKFPDIKTHIDSLYQGLLDVDTRVTKLKNVTSIQLDSVSGLATYQVTNEKNVTLLFERVDNIIEKEVTDAFYLAELNRRLVHVERLFGEFHKYVNEHSNPKKNTKRNIIPNIVKVGVAILFTTFN
jgi:uncharacterized coiled-coil protein SlyX